MNNTHSVRQSATTSPLNSSLGHAHFIQLFCTKLQIQSESYKSPSRVSFLLRSSEKKIHKIHKKAEASRWWICGQIARLSWPLLAFPPLWVFVLRRDFQKSASEEILCFPAAPAAVTWIGDYPSQVQIAKWQALEKHRARFTSWCVTEREGGLRGYACPILAM